MCEEGRGASCFGDQGMARSGGGGAVCPKKHPFQDPSQELTHLLPASTPYAPGASGFVVVWAGVGGVTSLGAVAAEGRTWYTVPTTEPLSCTHSCGGSGRVKHGCVCV